MLSYLWISEKFISLINCHIKYIGNTFSIKV